MKKRTSIALLSLCFLASCAGIQPGAIAPSVESVTQRHDQMLRGELDPQSVSEADRDTYLRTSELLRRVVSEAQR